MNAGTEPTAVSQAAGAGAPEKIIEARNVLKSFGETPALRGASLRVRDPARAGHGGGLAR
jgi:hypothetical protein